MFENIAGKLRIVATISLILSTISSIVLFIVGAYYGGTICTTCIISGIVLPCIAYPNALLIHGLAITVEESIYTNKTLQNYIYALSHNKKDTSNNSHKN